MRYTTRLILAAGTLGSVVFAGAALAGTSEDTPNDSVEGAPRPALGFAFGGPGGTERFDGQMLHGERSMLLEDGTVVTTIEDAGTIRRVDGNTLTIERADGSSIDIDVIEDARIGRNGEPAEIGDLVEGDIVHVHRTDGLETERMIIMAHSEDWEPERRPFGRHGGRHRFFPPAPEAGTDPEPEDVSFLEEAFAA